MHLSSGVTSARYLRAVPEMVNSSKTLYQGRASCEKISGTSHWGNWIQQNWHWEGLLLEASYLHDHFGVPTSTLQSAIASTETHMFVQQGNGVSTKVQTPWPNNPASRLGKGAASMFLRKSLLRHLNKSKELAESWLCANHKNPANWVLHRGETWYPTGCLIFLLKL